MLGRASAKFARRLPDIGASLRALQTSCGSYSPEMQAKRQFLTALRSSSPILDALGIDALCDAMQGMQYSVGPLAAVINRLLYVSSSNLVQWMDMTGADEGTELRLVSSVLDLLNRYALPAAPHFQDAYKRHTSTLLGFYSARRSSWSLKFRVHVLHGISLHMSALPKSEVVRYHTELLRLCEAVSVPPVMGFNRESDHLILATCLCEAVSIAWSTSSDLVSHDRVRSGTSSVRSVPHLLTSAVAQALTVSCVGSDECDTSDRSSEIEALAYWYNAFLHVLSLSESHLVRLLEQLPESFLSKVMLTLQSSHRADLETGPSQVLQAQEQSSLSEVIKTLIESVPDSGVSSNAILTSEAPALLQSSGRSDSLKLRTILETDLRALVSNRKSKSADLQHENSERDYSFEVPWAYNAVSAESAF